MRALAICVAILVVVALAPRASAQLPAGWAAGALPGVVQVNGVACAGERAALRTWGGQAAVRAHGQWTVLPETPGSREGHAYGTAIAVAPTGEVFLEAGENIDVWDGRVWTVLPVEHRGRMDSVGGIFALGAADVFATGRGHVSKRVGGRFASFDAGTWRDLAAVSGTAANDLWVGGQGGTIEHWDGTRWARATLPSDVWVGGLRAVTPRDVWAWSASGFRRGGGGGSPTPLVLHFDGASWTAADTGLERPVVAVAADATHVYAVTEEAVLRYAAATWTPELRATDLGAGYHRFAGGCTTTHELVVVSDGATSGAYTRALP